jgi:hypothetical protein
MVVGRLEEVRRELAREVDADGAPMIACNWHESRDETAEVLCLRVGAADIAAGHLVAEAVSGERMGAVIDFFAAEVRSLVPRWKRPVRAGDRRAPFPKQDPSMRGTDNTGRERTTVAVGMEKVRALELVGIAQTLTPTILADANVGTAIFLREMASNDRREPLVAAATLVVCIAYECVGNPTELLDDLRSKPRVAEAYTREFVRALHAVGEACGHPFDADDFLSRLRAAVARPN